MAATTTPNYEINYEDDRFAKVDADIQQQSSNLDQVYGGMIDNTDQFYNDLKQSTQDYADKQSQIQQEKTDFAIEQINQQKEQANKDYQKEQSGAYVDWQKQSNQYGAEAEKMAAAGLANTGYSESSQVSMYNTYQNRVATARESYQRAVLNYDNAIKDAQLQNNAALAEIAYNALQKQLELGLQGFQYKNQLILDLTGKKTELNNTKWNRYQDILNQINTENALAEDARQFNENLAFQETENEKERTFKSQEAELDRKFQAEQANIERKFKEKQAELDRKHDKEMLKAKTKAEKEILEQQHKNDLAKLKKQQEYEMAQLDKKLANNKALLKYEKSLKSSISTKTSGGSSKSSGSSKSGSSKSGSSSSKVNNNSSTSGKVSSTNILDMGYGPINANKASQLVDEGKLTYKVNKNGNITFSKTPQAITLPTWKLGKK